MVLWTRPKECISIAILYICILGSEGTSLCLSWIYQNGIFVLTCTVFEAEYPISFYHNYGPVLARCFIFPEPHECHTSLKNSKITYNVVNNQSTLKIWDLVSINGYWSCSHGSRNDTTSSVFIEDQRRGSLFWNNTKIEKTCFWIGSILVIVLAIINIAFICNDKWLKRMREQRLLTKGMKLLITCLIPITVIPLSYFLDDTQANSIIGGMIGAVAAILIFVIANTGNRDSCSYRRCISSQEEHFADEDSSLNSQVDQRRSNSVCCETSCFLPV